MIMIQDTQLRLKNFKKIITVKDEEIKVAYKKYICIIKGKKLQISYLTKYELWISGTYDSLEFIHE